MKQLLVLLVCTFICVQALNNGLGLTPQMGWNSWNHYGCGINESIVRNITDILVSKGFADLGYQYVNVDDCWAKSRNAQGVIQADPSSFPSGMQALANYVHAQGLRFGLYSDAGTNTCAGRPGSLGYETIDAKTYASWGVDYLKYDNCNAPENETPQQRYPVMRDALNVSGRAIFFSMCEWGVLSPWQWAQEVGNSWRTTMDIGDDWDSFIRVLDNNIGLAPFAGPGNWNDPDMLEVGNGGMNANEDRAHFALWCLLKAPLLIGCDLTSMSTDTFNTLSAKELIAVNQDPLGVQGDLIYQLGPIQIWAGPLADGSRAFILFNRHSETQYGENITINFADLGFPRGTTATIRDLYAREDVGVYKDMFTTYVMPHCVFAGRLIPVQSSPEDVLWRPWH